MIGSRIRKRFRALKRQLQIADRLIRQKQGEIERLQSRVYERDDEVEELRKELATRKEGQTLVNLLYKESLEVLTQTIQENTRIKRLVREIIE
jgi:polysaccharide pyruvyl transferase WcaK-like protein